jgi:hypothetical protein
MIDILENPRAVIGGNQPPELTPYEAIKLHIDDLMETAQGFLDGEPITTQAVADEVGKLLDEARKARTAADEQRKIEAKPFDDGKKAVQALWTPLSDEKTGKCALIAMTAKKALAPFLAAEQAKKEAIAAEARCEADRKAEEAQAAIRAADETDLAARENAEALLKEAGKAEREANRAGKDRATATGGARAVSLRTVWTATLTDPTDALKHYRAKQPEALKAWLLE